MSNSISVTGNLVRLGDVMESKSGVKFMRVCIADNNFCKGAGDKDQHTNFFDFTVFKGSVDFWQNASVGDKVVVIGGWIKISKYEGKDGGFGYSHSIEGVKDATFISKSGGGNGSKENSKPKDDPFSQPTNESFGSDAPTPEDDLPF